MSPQPLYYILVGKVVNPTEEASRMLELPHLYETCYDLPFCPPPEGRDGGTTAASSGSTGHNCEVRYWGMHCSKLLSGSENVC